MASYYNIKDVLEYFRIPKKWEEMSQDERTGIMRDYPIALTCVNEYNEPAVMSLPDKEIISLFQQKAKDICGYKKGILEPSKERAIFLRTLAGTTPDEVPFIEHFSSEVQKALLACVKEVREKTPMSDIMRARRATKRRFSRD